MWKLIEGKVPILLLAGHNFSHIRDGNRKINDAGTGVVVEEICARTGAWGMVATALQLDHNWHEESLFRQKAKQIITSERIKTVIDIHGWGEDRDEEIIFIYNQTFDKFYGKMLDGLPRRPFINSHGRTFGQSMDKVGFPVLEIEIRKDLRVKSEDNKKYEEMINLLQGLVGKLI
jgi:hypothetical protein